MSMCVSGAQCFVLHGLMLVTSYMLKTKFELARNKSTRCNDHKDFSACSDGYMEEELMSLIYNRVSDQNIRDCIDMLPDAEHTLEKYLHLGETQELSEANAAAFNPQPPTTQYMHSSTKAKVKVRARVSYVLLVATSLSMVDVKLRVKSARSGAK